MKAIIDRIEGDFLVLEIEGGQELFWPKNDFVGAKEGDELNIFLTKSEPDNEIKAKEILKQIFKKDV